MDALEFRKMIVRTMDASSSEEIAELLQVSNTIVERWYTGLSAPHVYMRAGIREAIEEVEEWKGVMSNKECECILTFKLGSCAIDALHDLTEKQQELLVAHCRDDWGQERIDIIVKSVVDGFWVDI